MINIYIRRIKEGKMTLSDVPLRWRNEVQIKLLQENE